MELPSLREAFSSGYFLSLKAILLILLLAGFLPAMFFVFPPAMLIAPLFFVVLPAAFIILGAKGSILKAMSPSEQVDIIRKLRAHYLLLIGFGVGANIATLVFGFVAVAAHVALASMFEKSFAIFAIPFSFALGASYLALVLFQLQGYMAYEFRVAPRPVSDLRSQSWEAIRREAWAAAAEKGSQGREVGGEGESHAGAASSETSRNQPGVDVAIRQRIFDGHYKAAVERLVLELANNPDYRPQDPDVYLRLVRALRASGRPRIAVRICNRFDRRFPGHDDVYPLYEIVASIYCEELGDPAMGEKVRRFIRYKM